MSYANQRETKGCLVISYLVFAIFFVCYSATTNGSWFGWVAQMYRCGMAEGMKVKAF